MSHPPPPDQLQRAACALLLEELEQIGLGDFIQDSPRAKPPIADSSVPTAEIATLNGEGDPNAQLFLILDAPDNNGRGQNIYSGESGELLAKMLESGMKLPRATVFACWMDGDASPFQQLLLAANPKLIIAMGEQSIKALVPNVTNLEDARGQLQRMQDSNIPIIASYHPLQLVEQPALKAASWQDLQVAMRFLGIHALPKTNG